jgi:hypothetical protein
MLLVEMTMRLLMLGWPEMHSIGFHPFACAAVGHRAAWKSVVETFVIDLVLSVAALVGH